MTFVEFVSSDHPLPGAKHYFVGANLDEILADTNGGKKFGEATFSSYREITEEEARILKVRCLEGGISAVQHGCKSYVLWPPKSLTYQFVLDPGSPTDELVEREAKKRLGNVNITNWCVVDDRHFFGAVHGRGRKPEDPPLIYVEYTE